MRKSNVLYLSNVRKLLVKILKIFLMMMKRMIIFPSQVVARLTLMTTS